ncbi:hypothetical protein TUBRATIS_004410 [Tubulinosema ratisbonensis]|uniref:Uncharacterized protein n=1 Tax=Tubulinosema ratisbonensis TaxID=291195 RepID=A0A437APD7_9MICR|nr:hypothetical protein TUBRATIS_004410 [Tubulinosema ratisbonensis]
MRSYPEKSLFLMSNLLRKSKLHFDRHGGSSKSQEKTTSSTIDIGNNKEPNTNTSKKIAMFNFFLSETAILLVNIFMFYPIQCVEIAHSTLVKYCCLLGVIILFRMGLTLECPDGSSCVPLEFFRIGLLYVFLAFNTFNANLSILNFYSHPYLHCFAIFICAISILGLFSGESSGAGIALANLFCFFFIISISMVFFIALLVFSNIYYVFVGHPLTFALSLLSLFLLMIGPYKLWNNKVDPCAPILQYIYCMIIISFVNNCGMAIKQTAEILARS